MISDCNCGNWFIAHHAPEMFCFECGPGQVGFLKVTITTVLRVLSCWVFFFLKENMNLGFKEYRNRNAWKMVNVRIIL